MDPSLKLAVTGALACFGLQILFVELLKAARVPKAEPGVKTREAADRATQSRAWLGVGASLCAFGQLIMCGWILFVVQALIQRQ